MLDLKWLRWVNKSVNPQYFFVRIDSHLITILIWNTPKNLFFYSEKNLRGKTLVSLYAAERRDIKNILNEKKIFGHFSESVNRAAKKKYLIAFLEKWLDDQCDVIQKNRKEMSSIVTRKSSFFCGRLNFRDELNWTCFCLVMWGMRILNFYF